MVAQPNAALLDVENCTMRFGGLTAVSELNLQIRERELIGLIGPNGAGKTTVFNLITGVYSPTRGNIRFAGETISGMDPHQITRRGIARTFQNIRLFPSLTVFDNVRVGLQLHSKSGAGRALWRSESFYKEEERIEKEALQLLDIFNLGRFRHSMARGLPYGDQRRLEIVRALATRPRLLLLDEPAAGMNPTEKAELMKLVQFIQAKFGISILLVEHDMQVVMGICQRVAVLDYGIKIAEDTPSKIRSDPKVCEAYLGEPAEP
jgi:branched-chain amino acid transport system ATP-binding protein